MHERFRRDTHDPTHDPATHDPISHDPTHGATRPVESVPPRRVGAADDAQEVRADRVARMVTQALTGPAPGATVNGAGAATGRVRRAPAAVPLSQVAQQGGGRTVIRRELSKAEVAQQRFEAQREVYREKRREIGRVAVSVGLATSTDRFDEALLEKVSGPRKLALQALLGAEAAYDDASRKVAFGKQYLAAADQITGAIGQLREAHTLMALDRSTGRELVAAKAGTATTSKQLFQLIDADVERRAAEIFEVLRGKRGPAADDTKTFNRLAQWLSDGTGGQIEPTYRRMHPTMWKALTGADADYVPPTDLRHAIRSVFGKDTPRTTYLYELITLGRVGPEARLISALGLLGPAMSFTFGKGLGDNSAVLAAAKTAPPDTLKKLVEKYRGRIRSKKLVEILLALADKQGFDQSLAAVEPLGLGVDDVAPEGQFIGPGGNRTQVAVEQRLLSALLAKYGHDRDKLLPELIQWSYSTDPSIIHEILRPTLVQFYARQRKQDVVMAEDVDLFVDSLVAATGIAGVSIDQPDSEQSHSSRRLVQIEALIADHTKRNKRFDALSKGAPPGFATQLLTSPTVKPQNLVDMIDQILDDGEAVRGLIAKYGDAAEARARLEFELGETILSKGDQQALLDRIFVGKHRAGDAYREFSRFVLDHDDTKKSKERKEFLRHLVSHSAALSPGEIDYVRTNRKLLAKMAELAGDPPADAGNWRVAVTSLGLTQREVTAAVDAAGVAGPGNTTRIAGDANFGPDETSRLLAYAEAGEGAAEGHEAASAEYWSARVTRLLSKEYGADKNLVAAVALLREAQLHFPADQVAARTMEIGKDVASVSSTWKKRISGAKPEPDRDYLLEKAKSRIARILATGRLVRDRDVIATLSAEAKSARGTFNKLQTKSGKMEDAWVAMPGPDMIRELSNLDHVRDHMRGGEFPRLVLDLTPRAHAYLASTLPRAKRLEVTRAIRDRLSDAAAEDDSLVERAFLANGLTVEQSKLFAVQTRVMADLDKERLLLSGVQWNNFNSLSQRRREARNEELAALRGARTDMKSAPGAALNDTAKERTTEIGDRSKDTRAAQAAFTAMRKKYRDRIILALNIMLTLAFTIASLGFGLPAAAAWVQILVTSLWIIASTAAVEFTKWALMGDSQSLTESLINLIFSIPTAVVAGFVAGPIGFSADVGLRMALDGLKEGAPFLEIALRSFLVGNINKALNAPVSGLQDWLTSEQDPEGAMHRVKSEVVGELKSQIKGMGMSVLKGLAKASIPDGMRESDITPENEEGTGTDERAEYRDVFGGSANPADWATFAYSPTDDQIGWSAAFRQAGGDIRNFALELATSNLMGVEGAQRVSDAKKAEKLVDADTPDLGADIGIYQVLTIAYTKAFFRCHPADVDFDPTPYVGMHVNLLTRHLAPGDPAAKQKSDEILATWNARQSDLRLRLANLPAARMRAAAAAKAK